MCVFVSIYTSLFDSVSVPQNRFAECRVSGQTPKQGHLKALKSSKKLLAGDKVKAEVFLK